ncbi:MAG: toxin-antitoxin system YwqK family antitoxin [Saprospiraceae bacterium]|nr:toxin-antitoxin system YwqK family antitoxin [Candidatus Defluviibacterium haderslevense]
MFFTIDKHILFNILLLLVSLSCKNDKIIEIRNANGLLTTRITVNGDTLMGKNGLYEYFDTLGNLIESKMYHDNKLDGTRKIYEKGALYSIEQYVNDEFHGTYQVFYPNGQLKLEGNYVHNVLTGTLKTYYENQQIKEIVEMANNEENGPFVEFHISGTKKAEGTYLNGPNEHGLLQLFDSTGILIRKMNCDHGICNTIWKRDSI